MWDWGGRSWRGRSGWRVRSPPEEFRVAGRVHSRPRDKAAVSSHYDVGNDFYRDVLGPSMVYSCAYWSEDPDYSLERAQSAKLDLICRKLGLHEGMRVLDLGCGWGSFAIHAAREYNTRVLGITLSKEQAELARRRAAELPGRLRLSRRGTAADRDGDRGARGGRIRGAGRALPA